MIPKARFGGHENCTGRKDAGTCSGEFPWELETVERQVVAITESGIVRSMKSEMQG